MVYIGADANNDIAWIAETKPVIRHKHAAFFYGLRDVRWLQGDDFPDRSNFAAINFSFFPRLPLMKKHHYLFVQNFGFELMIGYLEKFVYYETYNFFCATDHHFYERDFL